MAREDSWPRALRVLRLTFVSILDEDRPAGVLEWAPRVAPVVTQAVVGAGHWAAGRRQRALAEWAGAAGFGLVAWGLGTEAPTAAEVQESFRRQLDLMRKPGTQAPAAAGTETPAARRLSRFFRGLGLVSPVAWMVIDVPWRLRHPRRRVARPRHPDAEPRGSAGDVRNR